MTRRRTILAGRVPRPVVVEHRRRREVRRAGVEAVRAELFGQPYERARKIDIGCAAPGATGSENQPDLSTGALIADVKRQILANGKFGRVLWGWM